MNPTTNRLEFGLIGIPWDYTSFYPGPFNVSAARHGPKAFRAAFEWVKVRIKNERVFFFDTGKVIDLPPTGFFVDRGDVALTATSVEESFARIESAVASCIADGLVVIAIGGDDGITYPVVKGVHDSLGGSWGMIHLDAHMDLLDISDYQGRLSSSSGVRRSTELDRFRTDAMIQVGLRNFNFVEQIEYARARGITQITASEYYEIGSREAAKRALAVAGKADHIHLAFDLDALDGTYARFPGGSEPGGLNPRQVLDFIGAIAPSLDSMSLVEIYPIVDENGVTAAFAAQAVAHFIAAKLSASQNG